MTWSSEACHQTTLDSSLLAEAQLKIGDAAFPGTTLAFLLFGVIAYLYDLPILYVTVQTFGPCALPPTDNTGICGLIYQVGFF
jgi:hypothetical protein